MCRYSSTCRKDCTDALACPQVTAAFGPDPKHAIQERAGKAARQASGWWAKCDRKPVARRDEQGMKLCSREGCNAPRLPNNDKCREHFREYHREYARKHRDQRNAQYRGYYAMGKGK